MARRTICKILACARGLVYFFIFTILWCFTSLVTVIIEHLSILVLVLVLQLGRKERTN